MSITINSLTHLADVYSDSDEEEDNSSVVLTNQTIGNNEQKGIKRTRDNGKQDSSPQSPDRTRVKLEIPTGVLDMFQSTVSTGSESSFEHQGRVRSFDHLAGNWATHVLIPIDLPEHFSEFVTSLKSFWPNNAPELHIGDLNDVHVSISRTVPIRHHWISPLKEFLQRGFTGKHRFILDFPMISVYVNDEKTRSFVALDADLGVLELKKFVAVVDEAFEEFGLSKYYEKPSFHASFSWSLGDINEFLDASALIKMQDLLDSYMHVEGNLVFTAEEIQCRTGNKVFRFPLIDQ